MKAKQDLEKKLANQPAADKAKVEEKYRTSIPNSCVWEWKMKQKIF